MRVKELQKTVNVAWSPDKFSPIYLAAGTAAQQLDSSFSTDSALEIYDVNLSNSGYDMLLKGSQTSARRFHKLVWSPAGIGGNSHESGLIVGGCDNGFLQIYSASKLLSGQESLVAHQEKHTGPVKSLDFNPFQNNLIASGASESEIFIWDLNNTTTPMTPGAKTQPFEDVQAVAWNKQVQHILASVFTSRCVIWDLRKNEPIIKLSDSQSRVRWHSVQWNPEVATQLWLPSEEDQAPVIQLWDLRYSTAPAKSIQIHTRGVLSLSYCPKDPEMMVSCGKDYKILCWNPKSESTAGEILSEIATSNQWYSDISWCPKNPALIASTSLDGMVSLYSLFGADKQEQQTQNNIKLADSFPGMDPLNLPPQQQSKQENANNDLKKPPKWLRKPIGASFVFGGKLVSFSCTTPRQICITQVTTEPHLVEQTETFDEVLKQNNLKDYCRQRADQQQNQNSRLMWYFLKSNFEINPRAELLNLLGYDMNDMKSKYDVFVKPDVDGITNHVNDFSLTNDQNNEILFDSIAAGYKEKAQIDKVKKSFNLKLGDGAEGQITESILTGNLEAAVELCLEHGYATEAIIIANNAGPELLKKTQTRFLSKSNSYLANLINSLITNEWDSIIENFSIDSWKQALVAILTHSSNECFALCEKIGERLLHESEKDKTLLKSAILCYICSGNIEKLIIAWKKENKNKQELNSNIEELHELVEIVILLQKGIQLQNRNFEVSGQVADILNIYAKHLVAQGKLYSALTYLGDSSDDRIVDLKERIYYAIGHKTPPQQIKSTQPFNQQRYRSNSTGYGVSGFSTMPNQSSSSQPWNARPQQVSSPVLNNIPQQIQNAIVPPPTTMPTVPSDLMSQPARPPSAGGAGSISSVGSALHRSKYVLDPSVRSNQPSSNSYMTQNSVYGGNVQNQLMAQQHFQPAPAQQVSLFQPTGQQTTSFYSPQQNNFTPFVPQTTNLPLPPVNNTYDSNYLSSQSQSFPEPPPPLMPRDKNPTPPPGWNDPPAFKSRSRSTSQSQSQDINQNISAPITHPIFGQQEINQNLPIQPTPTNMYVPSNFGSAQQIPPLQAQHIQGYGGESQPNFDMGNNMYQDQSRQFTTTYQNQWNQNQNIPSKPQPDIQRAEIVEAVKKQIPNEFIHMQKTFDELRARCIEAATNPPTRRKLEDVGKRLEHLYDMLRESRLTPNTLQSLNELVNLVSISDYANSIALHTQMISGSDFSQIASFMPGIKILLQTAMQLNVYLK